MSSITDSEVEAVVEATTKRATAIKSALRRDANGERVRPRMHIHVVDRQGHTRAHCVDDDGDAWRGSRDIARGKARTAVFFSSNQNALSTRALGQLTQPGGPLWNIGNSNVAHGGVIEFPGGFPLYNVDANLIGGVGVSGDAVDIDEEVAFAAAKHFAAHEFQLAGLGDVVYSKTK